MAFLKLLVVSLCVLAAEGAPEVNATMGKWFIMMFENHGYSQVTKDKTWAGIIDRGMLLTNYHGVAHPSQPNYIASLGADTLGCSGDSQFSTNKDCLVDKLEYGGISWKTYQEDYKAGSGGDCNGAMTIGKYYRKHNPFVSFETISSNKTRCKNIVNADEFAKDLSSGSLKQFSYFTPNINDDSHDQPLSYSGKFLSTWLDSYLDKFDDQTYILITFDEDEKTEGNHIVAVMLGKNVKPKTKDDGTSYSHFSIAKTCSTNWGVPGLGRKDSGANSLTHALSNWEYRTDNDTLQFLDSVFNKEAAEEA